MGGNRVSQQRTDSAIELTLETSLSCHAWPEHLTLITKPEKITTLSTIWDLAGCLEGLGDRQACTRSP